MGQPLVVLTISCFRRSGRAPWKQDSPLGRLPVPQRAVTDFSRWTRVRLAYRFLSAAMTTLPRGNAPSAGSEQAFACLQASYLAVGRLVPRSPGAITLTSARGTNRANSPESLCFGRLCSIEVPPKLKVHPEARRVAKTFRQPQSGARSNSPPTINQLVHPLIGNPNTTGQVLL